jgi:deoxycytidine triphosphate deaminase
MLLTDKEITAYAAEGLLTDYRSENIQTVCYDLRTKYYCTTKERNRESCTLKPGESIFVQCVEGISLPADMTAEVHLRNGRIRQGLSLDAPVYYPGHNTVVFFRITNVSNSVINLHNTDELASIMFEKLSSVPEHPYNGTFQNEMNFDGMADYTDIFQSDMEEITQKQDNIRHIERNIYSNVITIMTVFVGLFTLINVNVILISSKEITSSIFLIFNLSTVGSIGFLTAVLQTFFSDGRHKGCLIWIISIIAFAAAILLHFMG